MDTLKPQEEVKVLAVAQATAEQKIDVNFELDASEEELLEEFGVLYHVEYPNAI
jgi:hypothetical protein